MSRALSLWTYTHQSACLAAQAGLASKAPASRPPAAAPRQRRKRVRKGFMVEYRQNLEFTLNNSN
ncbi:Uncharacterised protein [Bordetella pertussis]|nr:Uncharacterised protein [Bordetella pertussis]